MKKLKTCMFAITASLLIAVAIVSVILAFAYAVNGSPWYWIYALVAVPAAIGGRLLFWITDNNS